MYLPLNDNMIHQGAIPGVSVTNTIYCADCPIGIINSRG